MCHATCLSGTTKCEPVCARPEVRVLRNGQVTTSYRPFCEIKCPPNMCEMDACPSCEVVCRRPPAGYTIETKTAACTWLCRGGIDCETPACVGTPSNGGGWIAPRLVGTNSNSFIFIIFIFVITFVIVFRNFTRVKIVPKKLK